MIVHRRDDDGRVREAEFDDREWVLKEVHDNLMDLGYSSADALAMMMGWGVPDGVKPERHNEALDAVVTGEFLWLLQS